MERLENTKGYGITKENIIMKRYLLLIFFIVYAIIVFSENNSLNAGIFLLGIKNYNPYGGGVHIGYEYHVPKLSFIAFETRINVGKLLGEGLYGVNPIKEWSYVADYFMAGIIPRLYFHLADDLYLFTDTEIGLARITAKTFFSEDNNWEITKPFKYSYYTLRAGLISAISDNLKISLTFGYVSLDITDLINSNLPSINYRFKNQKIDVFTSFTFHVKL